MASCKVFSSEIGALLFTFIFIVLLCAMNIICLLNNHCFVLFNYRNYAEIYNYRDINR